MQMRDILNLVRPFLMERYEMLPPKIVYHGSKKSVVQQFQHQTGSRGAFFDVKQVMSNGFFFAEDIKDAAGFGPYVGAYEINLRHPLVTGADGIDGIRDPKRAEDLRYVLGALMKPDGEGHFVFNGMSQDFYAKAEHMTAPPGHADRDEDRDADWIYEFLGSGGIDWEVLDHPECIKRMVERGYDGTAVDEPGAKDNRAWFVINANQIRFIEQVLPQQESDQDEDW